MKFQRLSPVRNRLRGAFGPNAYSIIALAAGSVFALIFLEACSTAAGQHSRYEAQTAASSNGSSPSMEADDAMARGDYFYAARAYQQAAAANPANAPELRLRASEAAAAGNDFVLANNLLAQIPQNGLIPEQQLRYRIVRARAALARNDPATAASLLPADPPNTPFAERALMIRARALFRTGDTVGATAALVKREKYLRDDHAIAENHDAIWAGVSTAPLDPATLSRAGGADTTTRGWIELANLARRNAPLEFFNTWRKRYPGHPGEERLASLYMPGANIVEAPVAAPSVVKSTSSPEADASLPPAPPLLAIPAQNSSGSVAGSVTVTSAATSTFQPAAAISAGTPVMFLPTAGPLAGISEAVRSGFASASSRAGNAAPPTVIDVSEGAAQIADAYQRASAAGAGLIVGPLRKDAVQALSEMGPAIPVLALNYLDAGHGAGAGFYQFGLAPEDEARVAAEDAAGRGLRRAIAITQASDWGTRVEAAFEQRFTELGGVIVGRETYSGQTQSWSDPVKRLLHFRAIDDREKLAELRAASNGVDPQRRSDFDFIFLGAHGAGHARVLWPMFRFFHAERMPIYATAAVNEGPGDQDLAGIRFCDSPWLLDSTSNFEALRTEATTGRGRDAARLFALGVDAFALTQKMQQGGLRPGDVIAGATGSLQLDTDGAIHRGLICARMTNGGDPVPLGPATPEAP